MGEIYLKQLVALGNGWGKATKQDLIKCLSEAEALHNYRRGTQSLLKQGNIYKTCVLTKDH